MQDAVRELVHRGCVLVDELAQLPVQGRALGTCRSASGEGEHDPSSLGVSTPKPSRCAARASGLATAADADESGAMRDLDLGTGVFVALHGHGDDPGSARAWARSLAPAGWEIVAPGAPTR